MLLERANVKMSSWVSDIDVKSEIKLLKLMIGKEEFTP